MSTSITPDVPLRTPVAEAPHVVAQAAQPAAVEAAEVPVADNTPRFTSPVVKVDTDTGLALLVVRDGSTGKEVDQYPSRQVVAEYKRNLPGNEQTQSQAAAAVAAGGKEQPAKPAASAPDATAAAAAASASIKI